MLASLCVHYKSTLQFIGWRAERGFLSRVYPPNSITLCPPIQPWELGSVYSVMYMFLYNTLIYETDIAVAKAQLAGLCLLH